MFENIINRFKKLKKKDELSEAKKNKDTAKERLHLVLMQDRANVSADFLDMMKQEIIDVIKKYIDVDENSIDVKLTNQQNSDGTTGAPALYANIPIISIKDETRKVNGKIEIEKSREDEKKLEEKKTAKAEENNQEVNNNTEEDNNNDKDNNAEKEEKSNLNQTDNKVDGKANNKDDNKESKSEELKKRNNNNAYKIANQNNRTKNSKKKR